jgi:hypothetical protein
VGYAMHATFHVRNISTERGAMTLKVTCKDAKSLLSTIKSAIQKKDSSIRTWSVETDGDFAYLAEQYKGKGWMRAKPSDDNTSVTFSFIRLANTTPTNEIIAIYEARFIEMLLAHFRGSFVLITVS